LAVFLGLFTFPFWRNLSAKSRATGPDLVFPAQQKDCVMPVAYMRTEHMKLLLQWRNDVVRDNVWSFHAYDGKTYNMSLTETCLHCHEKATFCDRCHTYAGVGTPYCWNCHVDPAQVKGATQ
jgi:hypothetical protein